MIVSRHISVSIPNYCVELIKPIPVSLRLNNIYYIRLPTLYIQKDKGGINIPFWKYSLRNGTLRKYKTWLKENNFATPSKVTPSKAKKTKQTYSKAKKSTPSKI